MKELPYRDGTWFAVPLRDGGYALGLVARVAPKGGILLGYFFGPRRVTIPVLSEDTQYHYHNAVTVAKFSDQFLVEGKWPVLGVRDDWDKRAWPMPAFGRHIDSIAGYPERAWRVYYPDNDPSDREYETPISIDEYRDLPDDALYYSGAVEVVLTKLLGGTIPQDHSTHAIARSHDQSMDDAQRVDHFLYFPSQASATRAVARLEAEGYRVSVHESDPEWSVLATHMVRGETLDDAYERLKGLAEDEGGTYDGYERDVRAH